jgi:tetratricopeptide (TPR) repeat protein
MATYFHVRRPRRRCVNARRFGSNNGLGTLLLVQGKPDEAIASFTKAIELDPKLALAHNNVGFALGSQGKVDEAIACYKKAIQLDPKYVNAHFNLGKALSKKGKVNEAVRLLPQGHRTQATRRRGSQRPRLAAGNQSGSQAARPQSGPSFWPSAPWNSPRNKGNKDDARKWYDKAVQRMDKNQPKDEEPRRFRREAEDLLKIEPKKKPEINDGP